MKRILLAWEYGGALGHLARLRPLARRLIAAGHDITLALRPSPHIGELPEAFRVVPVPPGQMARDAIRQPVSMADVLYNQAASDRRALASQVRAWHGLFDLVRPDVVVLDHSPVALLAVQGYPASKVLLGTGFACPPAVKPLPDLRAWQNHYPDRIQATELTVLESLNAQLSRQNAPELKCVGQLFERVDASFLTTFPELDHYPDRTSGEYWGTWSDLVGEAPVWPEGDGPCIFAYLKPHRALPELLDHLAHLPARTLAYVGGPFNGQRWNNGRVRISPRPLDMGQVAQQCDLAVLHAGHGATAAMLLAGRPVLQLPIHIEQYHNAERTVALGAGVHVTLGDVEGFRVGLERLFNEPELTKGAQAFARRHADHDPGEQLERLVDRLKRMTSTDD